MAATGGIVASEAAAIAEVEAVVVTTTITTNETMRTATAAARGRQQQSTIGHSWISTAFAICLDFNIDLTVSQIVEGGGCSLRQRSLFLYKTLFLATKENKK